MKTKLIFVVPPQVHLLDLSGPAHMFYEALDEGADFDLLFINMIQGQEEVQSSSGLFLSRLKNFNSVQLTEGDYVFVPGMEVSVLLSDTFREQSEEFNDWLRQQYNKKIFICSVCTGAFVLAEAGILDGKMCTTHWKFIDRFKERFPKANLVGHRLFIMEENIMTSAGVASGIDMALYLIEKMMGPIFAARIAREVVVYLRRAETDPQLSVFLQYRNHIDDRIHRVQNYLAQHLQKKVSIEQLAEMVFTSPRNLTRLFKSTTRITIGIYQQKLRQEKAHQLLTEGYDLRTVSEACGLSTSQMRQLLRKNEIVLK